MFEIFLLELQTLDLGTMVDKWDYFDTRKWECMYMSGVSDESFVKVFSKMKLREFRFRSEHSRPLNLVRNPNFIFYHCVVVCHP